MSSREELFCHIDDFCQTFELSCQQQLLGQGVEQRRRARTLTQKRGGNMCATILRLV